MRRSSTRSWVPVFVDACVLVSLALMHPDPHSEMLPAIGCSGGWQHMMCFPSSEEMSSVCLSARGFDMCLILLKTCTLVG